MSDLELTIQALRDAVRLAPDNRELVEHLCRTLTQLGKLSEAETEYREALQRMPQEDNLKLGLAGVYYRQGKDSHALAITETLLGGSSPNARAQVLHARLLFRRGDVAGAVHHYKEAVEQEAEAADPEFAALLGIGGVFEEEEEVVDGRVRAAAQPGGDSPAEAKVERPRIRFADVGGMEGVKDEIRTKIIYPLQHAELYAAYGKSIGGGILMYGPPGCGKTHLARATAGEVDSGFISVGINQVLDMWLGNSERNLHELFEHARRNQPCVVFFDEVDALGASRSDMRQSAGRHLINQFLAELDGMDASNDGLLILGATNAPWHVDTAFRRPGRFDRVLFVPPPDEAARVEILKLQLAGKPQQDLELSKVAAKTRDFSGADLQALVDRAVEAKLTAAIKSGRPTPLTTKDLLAAARKAKPTTTEWFATARNYALYSNQGGTYDDVLEYLKLKK